MENWTELAERAKVDGFTRAVPTGETPTSGYMVALAGHEETFPAELFCAGLLSGYVARHWDALVAGDVFLGAWLSDGLVYVDVSENVSSRDKALFLAVLRNQLAIWDVVNGVEVSTRVGV